MATKATTANAGITRATCAHCDKTPAGANTRFLPGHDAQLRGMMLRAGWAASDDATADEVAASAAEMATVPDPEWAARWHAKRHPGDAARIAERIAKWAI